MSSMRLIVIDLVALCFAFAVAASARATDDRAHVSEEFRACMEQDADRSTWRPAEPERVPPGLDALIESAPLIAVLPAADGGRWLAVADLSFQLPPGADVSGSIAGAILIAERVLAETPFRELCVDASSMRWLERARPAIAAHLAPTPVWSQSRGVQLRRLD